MGYVSVYWNVDPSDYTGISASTLYSRVISAISPEAVVVMHAINPPQKAGALPSIIQDLRSSSYEPVTVTEILIQDD